MSYLDFSNKVNEIFKKRGWGEDTAPYELIEDWDSLVAECERGYNFGLDEYQNDIRIRERIELVLSDPDLQLFPELDSFSEAVEEIDERLKSLFIPDVFLHEREYWWERGVLSFAEERYAEDLKISYNITVKVVE